MASTKKTKGARKKNPDLSPVIAGLTVAAAVQRDLEKIGERDRELATGALAANALRLGKEMDSDSSATSKSMCARALNETMERIRAALPPEEHRDAIDELARKRELRRAATA